MSDPTFRISGNNRRKEAPRPRGRQLPVRPREVAGVAPRDALQVVLVLRLGLPERAHRRHLGDDLARPQPGRLDVRDRVLGDALLLVVGVEDRGAVGRADVVALAVQGGRVVDLEEELEQVAEARLGGVEVDLDRLGVAGVVAVRGVLVPATGVADPRRHDTGPAPDEILHAPETAAREHCPLCGLGHRDSSVPCGTWPAHRLPTPGAPGIFAATPGTSTVTPAVAAVATSASAPGPASSGNVRLTSADSGKRPEPTRASRRG
jgi:hypothetical protein